MTVTAATLVTRFPEFGNLETDVVTATITEALRQCDADVWVIKLMTQSVT